MFILANFNKVVREGWLRLINLNKSRFHVGLIWLSILNLLWNEHVIDIAAAVQAHWVPLWNNIVTLLLFIRDYKLELLASSNHHVRLEALEVLVVDAGHENFPRVKRREVAEDRNVGRWREEHRWETICHVLVLQINGCFKQANLAIKLKLQIAVSSPHELWNNFLSYFTFFYYSFPYLFAKNVVSHIYYLL